MKKSLAKSAIGVTIVMVVGYFLSFVKEAILANYYGISKELDAYTIAIQIPVILFAIISVAIRTVSIPFYSDLLINDGKQVADNYVNRLITIVIMISAGFVAIGELFAGGLVYVFAPGFDVETHALSTSLLRITLPAILCTSIQDVLVAVLNTHKKFVLPSFAVYLLNIGLIVSIVVLQAVFGIIAACIGQIIGAVLSLSFVALLARKVYHYTFIFEPKNDKIRETLKMSIPVLWSISIGEVSAMTTRVVASFLLVGSISAFSYATKIETVLMSLFISAITTIVFPLYAESAARQDTKQLSDRINFTLSVFTLFITPLMMGVFIYKRELVQVLFERGSFDTSAVDVTQTVLGYITVGMLFLSFRSTLTNVYHSLKDTKTPAINSTIGLIVGIVLQVVLAFIMGIRGLALAKSLSAILITCLLLFQLVRKYKGINFKNLLINVKKVAFSSIIMFSLLMMFKHIANIDKPLLSLLVGFLVGIVLYAICILTFRVPIVRLIIHKIKK